MIFIEPLFLESINTKLIINNDFSPILNRKYLTGDNNEKFAFISFQRRLIIFRADTHN
jgi:hypothetical protein